MIEVQPTTLYPTLKWIDLKVIELILDVSCKFRVCFFNDVNIMIDERHYDMAGQEYQDWGADDTYPQTTIFTAYGLVAV